MSFNVALFSAAAAATLVAALAQPIATAAASPAKYVRCINTPPTVSAVGHGAWGTEDRTHNGAITEWQSAVSERIGPNYASWSNAIGGDVTCHRELFKVVCVATATPCRG